MENKQYWFVRRTYGYGWKPNGWEGWAITLTWLYVFFREAQVASVHSFTMGETLQKFAPEALGLIVIFAVICWLTGESPKWQWGEPPQTLTMHLEAEPFAKIKSGDKKLEWRVYDEKRRHVQPGDLIEFQLRPENTETLQKKVVALHLFDTFEEGFTELPDERVSDIYQHYTPEDEQKYGVVGIELA